MFSTVDKRVTNQFDILFFDYKNNRLKSYCTLIVSVTSNPSNHLFKQSANLFKYCVIGTSLVYV